MIIQKTTAISFTAAGNNFELALAAAIATFGLASPIALPPLLGLWWKCRY